MSLARKLMNGDMVGVSIDAARYGHSNGATRIAMESVEELHEIFMESFYDTEQIELAAATEGVEVEGSRFETMLEATNQSVLQRVKTFLQKLWEKVKAFFHNVKRFFAAIIMSGRDFVKKYKSDIDKVKGMKDFEFEMYKYDNDKIDTVAEISDADGVAEDIVNKALAKVNEVTKFGETKDAFSGNSKGMKDDQIEKTVKDVKESFNETWENTCRGKVIGKGPIAEEDFDEELFKYFRNGATDAQDKEKLEFTEIRSLASVLESSKADTKLDSLQSKLDKAYTKARKAVDDMEKEISKSEDMKNKSKVVSAISSICSEMSSAISRTQTINNKMINAQKQAFKERDAAYKACIMAAFSHFRKQK